MTHEEISLQTKKQLAAALKEAMEKKPFSKITVSELIAACGMNRKTFYYHFSDIYDLLVWMFEQEAVEVVKSFDLIVDSEEAIHFVMDYIDENKKVINCAYNSIGRDALKRFFCRDFEGIALELIRSAEELYGKELSAGYREYLCRFYTEGLSGVMLDWIQNREKRSREEVVNYTVSSIRDSLTGIMKAQ